MNGTHEDLETRKNDWGAGVYATKNLEVGILLAIFGGRVVRVDEEDGDWGVQVEKGFVLSPMRTGNQPKDVGFFVNHSRTPNAGIRG